MLTHLPKAGPDQANWTATIISVATSRYDVTDFQLDLLQTDCYLRIVSDYRAVIMAPAQANFAPSLDKFRKSLKSQPLEASIESLISYAAPPSG